MREDGFYWITYNQERTIGEWESNEYHSYWWVCGSDEPAYKKEVTNISKKITEEYCV